MLQPSLILLLWLPITVILMLSLPPRKAVLLCLIGGALLLPQRSTISLPFMPDYSKETAIGYCLLVGVLGFTSYFNKLEKMTPKWVDIPILVYCLMQAVSSLSNDLGIVDALNSLFSVTLIWGVPYLIGRLLYNDHMGLDILAKGIFLGGLAYVPLCLIEARMSPQLHRIVYGYHQHSFGQTKRFGGFRPMVFMQHGLAVALWMTIAALVGFWLWKTGALSLNFTKGGELRRVTRSQRDIITASVFLLLFTALSLRSIGALFIGILGMVVLVACSILRSSIPIVLLISSIVLYVVMNVLTSVDLGFLIDLISDYIDPGRANSLSFRLMNEEILKEKAREQILFGWGGWGRFRVEGTIPDSLWIITFGKNGIVGLFALLGITLIPPFLICTKIFPGKTWGESFASPAVALSLVPLLFMVDSLVNDMFVPMYPLVSGALVGFALNKKRFHCHPIPR